mgnify:CR=1 FL=1
MDAGALVPDDVIIGLVKDRIKQSGQRQGLPVRRLPAHHPAGRSHDDKPASISTTWWRSTWTTPRSSSACPAVACMPARAAPTTSTSTRPRSPSKDDVTGEDLIQRADDAEETVRKRLDVYHKQTKQLVDYYSHAGRQQRHLAGPSTARSRVPVQWMQSANACSQHCPLDFKHGSITWRKMNAFYAQSGGVTAVINASACGVIETARKHTSKIGKLYAGRNGIIGALTEELIDTGREPARAIAALRYTPAGAFGSARYKLKSLEQNRAPVRTPDRSVQGPRHRLLLLQRRRRFGRHLP